MSVPSVLIRISTGEIIKHDILPVDPSIPVPGLDPDLKWLIKYEPFASPQYDARIFNLERTEEVTTTAHPDWPLYDQYLITYATLRRPVEEIELEIVNKERVELQRHIDYADKLSILGLAVIFRQLDGLQLTPVEQQIRDRIVRNGLKIYRNYLRRRQLEQEAATIQTPDIDAGWEAPDDDPPV